MSGPRARVRRSAPRRPRGTPQRSRLPATPGRRRWSSRRRRIARCGRGTSPCGRAGDVDRFGSFELEGVMKRAEGCLEIGLARVIDLDAQFANLLTQTGLAALDLAGHALEPSRE